MTTLGALIHSQVEILTDNLTGDERKEVLFYHEQIYSAIAEKRPCNARDLIRLHLHRPYLKIKTIQHT